MAVLEVYDLLVSSGRVASSRTSLHLSLPVVYALASWPGIGLAFQLGDPSILSHTHYRFVLLRGRTSPSEQSGDPNNSVHIFQSFSSRSPQLPLSYI